MDLSPKKEKSADAGVHFQKSVVIPDECGDSLWDAVLEQDDVNALPANSIGEDKDILSVGHLKKEENPNNTTVILNANRQ